jgi:hypothetical protein
VWESRSFFDLSLDAAADARTSHRQIVDASPLIVIDQIP